MWFFTGIRVQAIEHGVLRPFLCFLEKDGTIRFEAQSSSGAWIHFFNNQLKGADIARAEGKAGLCIGSFQPLPAIKLDEYELNVLRTHYPVHG